MTQIFCVKNLNFDIKKMKKLGLLVKQAQENYNYRYTYWFARTTKWKCFGDGKKFKSIE